MCHECRMIVRQRWPVPLLHLPAKGRSSRATRVIYATEGGVRSRVNLIRHGVNADIAHGELCGIARATRAKGRPAVCHSRSTGKTCGPTRLVIPARPRLAQPPSGPQTGVDESERVDPIVDPGRSARVHARTRGHLRDSANYRCPEPDCTGNANVKMASPAAMVMYCLPSTA